MKKYTSFALLLVGLLVVAQAVSARTERVAATNTRSGVGVTIPPHAVQLSDTVFSLGHSIDQDTGERVEGRLIVHRKRGYGKPPGTPGKGGGNGKGSTCYGFLAKEAMWKTAEPWVVNPANPDGIPDASVFSILNSGIDTWEDAADGTVGDGQSIDILGVGSTTPSPLAADYVAMDGVNEVYFDVIAEGTIGVTVVWGIFGGPPQGRELREWDQVYNTFYAWSDSGEAGKMDFNNIGTHELGHSVGLGDLYDTACSEETMYGFGVEGETKKRDLNAGDIAGISKLY